VAFYRASYLLVKGNKLGYVLKFAGFVSESLLRDIAVMLNLTCL